MNKHDYLCAFSDYHLIRTKPGTTSDGAPFDPDGFDKDEVTEVLQEEDF